MLKKDDQEVWEETSGGGCLLFFGLPFLLTGLALIAGSLGIISIESFIESEVPWYLVFLIGMLFGTIGAVLAFGRAGLTIDRRQNKIIRWYGVWSWVKRTEYPIDNYLRLTVTRETRSSGKSSYTAYPVQLRGGEGTNPIEIEAPRDYPTARKTAEALARFLNRPLEDSTSGETMVRQAAELDQSIRERVRRAREKVAVPDPPARMKSRVYTEGGSTVIEIPSPGIWSITTISMAMSILVATLVVYMFLFPLMRLEMPKMLRDAFIGFFALFALLPILNSLFKGLARITRKVKVSVSSQMLRVDTIRLFKKEAMEIPAPELEELAIPGESSMPEAPAAARRLSFLSTLIPGQSITATSDRCVVHFGEGLPAEELRYLHALILKTLTD